MNNKINWDTDIFDDIDGLKGYIKEYLEKDTIKFAGKEGVKIPTKREEDAGYDVYAFFEDTYIEIAPHETKIIPTGLYSAFSSDYVAVLHERGSNGVKGIGQRSGVIDSGYRGEWGVPLTNHNDKPLLISKFTGEELISALEKEFNTYQMILLKDGLDNCIIYPYSKAICQAIFLPVPKLKTKTISIEELKTIPSERGEGKLGSSNK